MNTRGALFENENSEEVLTWLLPAWVQAQTVFYLVRDGQLQGKPTDLGKSGLAPLLGYGENPHRPFALVRNPKHNYSANTRMYGEKIFVNGYAI